MKEKSVQLLSTSQVFCSRKTVAVDANLSKRYLSSPALVLVAVCQDDTESYSIRVAEGNHARAQVYMD